MKRFIPFLVALPSIFFAAPAFTQQCLNGWCKAGCSAISGGCDYIKITSRNYPYVTFQVNTPDGMFMKQADCQQYKSRFVNPDGTKDPWKPVMPGSVGLTMIKTACSM